MQHGHITHQRERFSPGLTPSAAPDLNRDDRPGVPEEASPPHPVANAHWNQPEGQENEPRPLIGANMDLKPVYSTAIPPRGISGLIRRAAYRIPEHHASRWMLLLLADRVDALEHEPAALAKTVSTVGLVALTVYAIRAVRNR